MKTKEKTSTLLKEAKAISKGDKANCWWGLERAIWKRYPHVKLAEEMLIKSGHDIDKAIKLAEDYESLLPTN